MAGVCRTGVQKRDPNQKGLLQDEDHRGGNDIAGVAPLGIEQRHRRHGHGLDAGSRPSTLALLHHASGGDFCSRFAGGGGDGRHGGVVEQEIAGIAISGDRRATPGQKVALEEFGNDEDGEGLPGLKRPARGHHVGNRAGDLHSVIGADTAQQLPGRDGIVLIDHNDGRLAHHLAQIGLRIKQAIDDDRQNHDREGGPVLEYRRKGILEFFEPRFHTEASFISLEASRGRRMTSSSAARTA